MSLTVKSSRINNCQIFQLQGKILSEEDAEILKEATSNLVLHNVIFDLEALTHINSTGIAVFVKTMTKCRIENGDLLFCAPNQLISTLFKITKMNDVFSMYDSLESATNYFK
ncbi:STAS domain-containing protein [Crocinitomicaceae bacterium]|nr:STAS domain-containing protein [Crocinitomicaceae bacterium]